MEKFNYLILIVLTLFTGTVSAQKTEKVWEVTDEIKTPESVLYDDVTKLIYVSNINGDPTVKDGNGYISVITTDGKTKNAKWVTGLNAPKGMAIFNGKLFVSDIDQLVKINIEKGEIEERYEAPAAIFLNDVTVTDDGTVFVSDNRAVKIYILKENKLAVWNEGQPFKNPNGLLAEGNNLFVGDENIYEIDLQTKKVRIVIEKAGGVDGLEKNEKGEFIFSNWPGRVFIQHAGKTIKLIDTTDKEIKTADIDYAKKPGLLLVPTFFNNKIIAYKITY